jgi:signal transduction histidine kinase
MKHHVHRFTLRTYALLWVFLPLALMIAILIAIGVITYQRTATRLLAEQQRHLAEVSALSISNALNAYANHLKILAAQDHVQQAVSAGEAVIWKDLSGLEVFDRGVHLIISPSPGENGFQTIPSLTVQDGDWLVIAQDTLAENNQVFKIIRSAETVNLLAVSVPVSASVDESAGILIGFVNLPPASLNELAKKLILNQESTAFILDQDGAHIFQSAEVDSRYTQNTFKYIQENGVSESGGRVWQPDGKERIIEGFARIGETGWVLVVWRSWEAVAGQIRAYRNVVLAVGAAAIAAMIFLSWQSVRKLVSPIQILADQANQLAQRDSLDPLFASGIEEIDILELAFAKMASQISQYRAGLRSYVGAITDHQEEERRRIARELHDETIQSLLAISRRLELYQGSETDHNKQKKLVELQDVVSRTLTGIREISRDLRPMILEDLGLVPAMKELVNALRRGEGAIPHAHFEVKGQALHLKAEQELALYRITQEALNNIRKHANATGARVALLFEPGHVLLEVEDDGTGFEAPANLAELAQHGCFGLMGIQERVWSIEGTLTVQTSPGSGTRLIVLAPVR